MTLTQLLVLLLHTMAGIGTFSVSRYYIDLTLFMGGELGPRESMESGEACNQTFGGPKVLD